MPRARGASSVGSSRRWLRLVALDVVGVEVPEDVLGAVVGEPVRAPTSRILVWM